VHPPLRVQMCLPLKWVFRLVGYWVSILLVVFFLFLKITSAVPFTMMKIFISRCSPVGEVGDIVTSGSMHVWLCSVCIYNHFHARPYAHPVHHASSMHCTTARQLHHGIGRSLQTLVVKPRAGSGSCGFFVRIGPIRFLAGCRKRRLNQG